MRVIAGSAKGTKLKPPKGAAVRPTADRVKEALFSILAPEIPGSFFIDLFAGSGAIGLEALSRGASHCIFVENNQANILLIKENLVKARLSGKARLVKEDVFAAINRFKAENIKADLLFADPPYQGTDRARLVTHLLKSGLLKEGGLLIIEHARADQGWLKNFNAVKQRAYGKTCLTFIA